MASTRLATACLWALVLCLAPGAAATHDGIHEQIERLTTLIESSPSDAGLYLKRGELFRLHGDWKRALADYDRATVLAPRLSEVNFARGRMLFEAGRYGEAVAALDRFVECAPLHVDARLTRARSRDALGDHIGAADDFARAMGSMSLLDPDICVERARALAAAGGDQRLEALRVLDGGISRLGPIVTLELCAVDVERSLGRVDEALGRIARLASQSPRKETWLVRRGEILDEAGRTAEARAAYEAAHDAIRAIPPHRRTKVVVELDSRISERLHR